MTDSQTIAADASWLPHRIDVETKQVEFLRIPRETLANTGFLSDRDPPADQRAMVSWDELLAMKPAPGQLHFIFHTAFCRSTLLVRAMDAPGTVAVLNEPFIIASIVNAGEAARPLIPALMALIARPWSEGEAVIVKPTNHSNMIMPTLLQAVPDARAVLMSNALPAFLRSVAKRGLMGRNWVRKLFIEMQTYAALDFGMNELESFALTDMQTGGLAWLLNQRYFAAHLDGQVKDVAQTRVRMLDGDRFDAEREQTIAATLAFMGITAPDGLAAGLANSVVFEKHSKLGGEFSGDGQVDDPVLAQEIEQIGKWVGVIADQAGITAPLRHTLF